jgi:hypothetical protein
VFAVFCEGAIFVAQAKTQCSTSPGTHLKDPNGSCNELLEPEVVTPAALILSAVESQVLAFVSAIQVGLSAVLALDAESVHLYTARSAAL